MAKLRFERVGTQVSWSASGSISQECSPVPFTVTGIMLVAHMDITTTSVTNFNDYWDRAITRLTLTGQANGKSKSFLDFSNMRLPYHHSRFHLLQCAPKRPTVIAGSATNSLQQFAYYFHFGVQPFKNGRLNMMDLTAGIPPTAKGQLTLGGAFSAAANVLGTNVTINDGDLDIWLVGVQEEPGDPPALYMPQAFPVWSMTTPTPTATSGMFATPYNVTSGDFLHSLTIMTTNGTNAPRDDQVLNSVRLYFQKENRPIITFGGRAGASDAAGGDYKVAELMSQLGLAAAPPSDDNSTLGAPAVTAVADEGLFQFRLADYTTKVHPLYGADMRGIATGDIRMDMGVNDATGIALDVLYQRYELNPEHPANAGWL